MSKVWKAWDAIRRLWFWSTFNSLLFGVGISAVLVTPRAWLGMLGFFIAAFLFEAIDRTRTHRDIKRLVDDPATHAMADEMKARRERRMEIAIMARSLRDHDDATVKDLVRRVMDDRMFSRFYDVD